MLKLELPLKKSSPSFLATLFQKLRSCQAPFFENLVGGSTPISRSVQYDSSGNDNDNDNNEYKNSHEDNMMTIKIMLGIIIKTFFDNNNNNNNNNNKLLKRISTHSSFAKLAFFIIMSKQGDSV